MFPYDGSNKGVHMKNKEKLTLTLLVICLVLCVVAIIVAVVIDKNSPENDEVETTVQEEATTVYEGEPGDIDIDISDLF